MTQFNKFQSMGTGSFLKNAFNKDGSAVYSGTGFRHLIFESSFPEHDQNQISNTVQLCIFDKEQNIYRLWSIQSVGNTSSPLVTAWQEYCSADLVTWVHNRDYNVNFSQNIIAITSTFKDGNNIYGYGPHNRVIQVTGADGNTYNFYTPKLGLCPITDNTVHAPISFYNETNKTYFTTSAASDGKGVSITTYTNSETPTTVEVAPGNSTNTYSSGSSSYSIIDAGGNSQYYIYCTFTATGGTATSSAFCPIFNTDGSVNTTPAPTLTGSLLGNLVLENSNENIFITSGIPVVGNVTNGTLAPQFPDSLFNSFAYSQAITSLGTPTSTTDSTTVTNTYALPLPQTVQEANDGYVRQIGNTSIYGYSFVLSLNITINSDASNQGDLFLPNITDETKAVHIKGGNIVVAVDGPYADYIINGVLKSSNNPITLNGNNILLKVYALLSTGNINPLISLNSATIYYD